LTLEESLSEVDTTQDSRVLDVDTLAIFFVEDHPGYRYVSESSDVHFSDSLGNHSGPEGLHYAYVMNLRHIRSE
jgi:hypothetical protein